MHTCYISVPGEEHDADQEAVVRTSKQYLLALLALDQMFQGCCKTHLAWFPGVKQDFNRTGLGSFSVSANRWFSCSFTQVLSSQPQLHCKCHGVWLPCRSGAVGTDTWLILCLIDEKAPHWTALCSWELAISHWELWTLLWTGSYDLVVTSVCRKKIGAWKRRSGEWPQLQAFTCWVAPVVLRHHSGAGPLMDTMSSLTAKMALRMRTADSAVKNMWVGSGEKWC